MGERTGVFVIGSITFLAALVFVKGIVRVLSETHPDSLALTALDEITD